MPAVVQQRIHVHFGANPVAVTAGSTTSNINAAMAGGRSDQPARSPPRPAAADYSGICVLATIQGGSTPGSARRLRSGGLYTIGLLPSGTYTIEFMSGCGNTGSYSPQWYNGTPPALHRRVVRAYFVATGANVTGINAAMQPTESTGFISGTVTAAGGGGLASVCATATQNGGAGFGSTITFTGGLYTINGLLPGAYTVDFEWCGITGSYAEQWYKNQSSSRPPTPCRLQLERPPPNINAAMVAISPPGAPTGVTASPGAEVPQSAGPLRAPTAAPLIASYTVTAADSTKSANGGETCTTTGALSCTSPASPTAIQLHLHRHRDQRCRHGSALGCVEFGQAGRQ